mmetsp:Transcript_96586/g.277998  ORF Transcript_96586/g.277998 Transcript_96586/m.277998 type:complete len:91 (+) Transcript_96586:96-368(+)
MHGGKDAPFVLNYGELELTSKREDVGVVRAVAFVQFPWPLLTADGGTDIVTLGLSEGTRPLGTGTPATNIPQPLHGPAMARPCAMELSGI